MLYRDKIMKHFVAEWDRSGVQKPKKNESLETQWNLSAQLPKLAKLQSPKVNGGMEQIAWISSGQPSETRIAPSDHSYG